MRMVEGVEERDADAVFDEDEEVEPAQNESMHMEKRSDSLRLQSDDGNNDMILRRKRKDEKKKRRMRKKRKKQWKQNLERESTRKRLRSRPCCSGRKPTTFIYIKRKT